MAKTYISIKDEVSSGGGSGEIEYYSETFGVVDWSGPTSGYFFVTIPASNHGKTGNVTVSVFELVSGSYEEVDIYIQVNGSLDVSIRVDSNIDNRFQGKVLIL